MRIRTRIATAIGGLAVSAAGPAAAVDSLYDMVSAAPKSAGPIGAWQTTVTREPVVVASLQSGWQTSWTTTTSASGSSQIATGSIARAAPQPHLPGPRLTGTGHALSGVASYYWQDQMTATGEQFNKRDLTAAHKTLPFGTRVRVTRVDTGGSVVVRINDRGPYKEGRVIDLSERAAENLGITGPGTAPVRLEVLGQ